MTKTTQPKTEGQAMDFYLGIWNHHGLYTMFAPAVGRNGYGSRGTQGDKMHLLSVEYVIGLTDEARAAATPGSPAARFMETGQPVVVGIQGRCNRSRTYSGVVVEGAGFADITCGTCGKTPFVRRLIAG